MSAEAARERAARVVLAGVVVGLVGAAAALDLPAASGGRFWSDGATYYAMAWSLARDGDVRYERGDLERVRREFPGGPDGLFLKRSRERLYFAKALLYPLAAAPFVRLFGTRGLLVTNALSLGLALALGYALVRRRAGPLRALALVLAVFLCGVAPVYLVWPQPELFNLGLISCALFLWRGERPLLSALLFGLATYSKPTNLLVALPLGAAPFFSAAGPSVGPGLRESLRRGLVLAATAGALYGLNAMVTGEWNYQGGERKTFYGRFPLEAPQVSFDNSGSWMTTEQLGPALPEAGAEAQARERGVIERPAAEMREAFVRNLGYFWVGRFAGVAGYFFPAALGALLFLVAGPRDRDGWLTLAGVLVSAVAYIAIIPDNWYGGGGTLGNRYFLNLLPLALCFVPRGRELPVAAAAAVVAAVVLGPALASPVQHSLRPWLHALRLPLRALPLELTMLNDLGFCSDPWRKKQPFGDPEGQLGRPADPRAYWLYFPDDGTYGKEVVAGREGFWLRRGHRAELVLRALEPVERVVLRLNGGPLGDVVRIQAGGAVATLPLRRDQPVERAFPPGRAYPFYLSQVHTLHLESQGAEMPGLAPQGDPRRLGAFVSLELELAASGAGRGGALAPQ